MHGTMHERGSFTKVKKGDYKGGETKGRDIVAVQKI